MGFSERDLKSGGSDERKGGKRSEWSFEGMWGLDGFGMDDGSSWEEMGRKVGMGHRGWGGKVEEEKCIGLWVRKEKELDQNSREECIRPNSAIYYRFALTGSQHHS